MALFNFFSKKRENGNNESLQLANNIGNSTMSMLNNSGDDYSGVSAQPLRITLSTGWPIDLIYGYLNKNYEQKGYEDAMLNSNLTFRDMNKDIIKNKILMVFREINLNYDARKEDLDTRINTCNAAGLLTNLAELNRQMSVITAHKNELAKMESDFRNNANEASIPLQSYECGFLRGVSTITMATPSRTQQLITPVPPTMENNKNIIG